MNITYIHHSGFLLETDRFYYLFDYETGSLPTLDPAKPIFVLSSHSHSDHYNLQVFSLLSGMHLRAILSDDITPPAALDTLAVAPNREYLLAPGVTLTTFRSTDLGVAFLLEEDGTLIYHAGDLNDWVWDEETDAYNRQMTEDYRRQIDLLSQKLLGRQLDVAFLVLDPRQEKDYARGICYFLEQIPARRVYPMHYWDQPSVIDTFLTEHPQYAPQIHRAQCAEKR